MKAVFLFMLLQFLPAALWAIQGDVELSIEKDTDFWISQKVKLTLKIKTDAFSMQNLTVDTQHNEDFIIIKPESAAYNGSEESDDGETSWQYNVYEYFIYPLRSGEITVKPFKVEFSASMGYGQPKQTFNLQTQDISFSVARPEGIGDKQFVLSTPSFTLDVSYEPDVDELKVGDAFERTVTITAIDVPDVLLPPVPDYKPGSDNADPGFKIYRSEPVLSEADENQQHIATRIEHDTFVAASAGEGAVIKLPGIKMYWWHQDKQLLFTESIPAKSIRVVENPLLKKESLDHEHAMKRTGFIKDNLYGVLAVLSIIFAGAFWWLPALKKKYERKKSLFEKSVEGHFKYFKQACFTGTTEKVYQAFYAWAKLAMPEITPLNFRQIGHHYPELKTSLAMLESALINKDVQFKTRVFYQLVSRLHEQLQSQQINAKANELVASLNPGSFSSFRGRP